MGREIKRVPIGFDWPMNQVWKGYLNPYDSQQCSACKGDGSSPEYREIADSFYDLAHHRGGPNGRSAKAWADKLTQEEVNLLIDERRLFDFGAHIRVDNDDGKFLRWDRMLNEDGTPYYPTAEEVNAWERGGRGMGHDAINRHICVEYRTEKAGIVGDKARCPACGGEGCFWVSETIKLQHQNFHGDEDNDVPGDDPSIGEIWTEPPTGEAWQVWETVSEGSPVSPAFATAEELVDYLVEGGDAWCRSRNAENPHSRDKPPSREAAENFVKNAGWVPSMLSDGKGNLVSGIAIAEES